MKGSRFNRIVTWNVGLSELEKRRCLSPAVKVSFTCWAYCILRPLGFTGIHSGCSKWQEKGKIKYVWDLLNLFFCDSYLIMGGKGGGQQIVAISAPLPCWVATRKHLADLSKVKGFIMRRWVHLALAVGNRLGLWYTQRYIYPKLFSDMLMSASFCQWWCQEVGAGGEAGYGGLLTRVRDEESAEPQNPPLCADASWTEAPLC